MRLESYGEYYEDCFIIKLNIPIDFANLANSDDAEHLGTLFHEYVHFLQNISTTFGNFSMAIFYAKMLNIFNLMSTSSNQLMSKVIHYNADIDPFIIRHEIILGDMDDWTYYPCSFILVEDVELSQDLIMEELGYGDCVVPQVKLIIVRNGIPEHKVLNFGAMCIMESMADMMDLHLYGKSKQGEFVQYDMCKKLWEYYIGNSRLSDALLFRCCEYSLMFDNHGQIFQLALSTMSRELRSGDISAISEDTINDLFQNRIGPSFIKTYEENYQEMVRLVKDLIPDNNSFTSDVLEYVIDCYKYFHEIRESNLLYFTKIYETEPKLAKYVLNQCMHIAVPLVINSENETFMPDRLVSSGVGLEIYAAYYAVYNLFNNNHTACELMKYCSSNSSGSIKDFCDKEPLISVDEKKLCVLGQILYMWQSNVRHLTTF